MSKSPSGFKATVTCFIGAPGMGKTTMIRLLIKARGVTRYIFVDPHDDPDIPGEWTCYSLDEAFTLLKRETRKDEWSIVYVTEDSPKVNPAHYLGEWALTERAILVLDEAHEYASTNILRSSLKKGGAPALLRIARRGRHYDCGLWLATQRPSAVSRDLTANSERYFFRLEEPVDLDYCRATLGKELSERIANLKECQYIYRCGPECYEGVITWKNEVPQAAKVRDLTFLLKGIASSQDKPLAGGSNE